MAAIIQPVRFDRMQAALVSVLAEATGVDVAFAYGDGVFDGAFDRDFINVTPILGPRGLDRGSRGIYMFPASVVELSIDSVIVGQRYLLDVNRHGFAYDAVGGNTADNVIDGLIAAIGTDSHVTATKVAGPLLRIVPKSGAFFWHLQLHGPISADTITLAADACKVVEDVAEMTLAVGCFSKGATPMDGAWTVAGKAAGAFEATDLLERLRAADVAVLAVGGGTDLADVAGAAWQTRVSFDVRITLPATIVRPTDRVERIDVDLQSFSVTAIQP
jgi:hypothetical protein